MRQWLFISTVVTLLLSTFTTLASIDDKVITALKTEKITPSQICGDEVFARRVYLVVAGRVPTLEEAQEYLLSKSKTKRKELVDKLLTSDDFVNMLTLKWGDLLKVKSEFPSNMWPNGAQAYNRWIRVHVRDNTPYNEFVRDMLLSSGSNFRKAQVNFYRAFVQRTPEAMAENIELLFLGRRTPQPLTAQFFEQVRYKNTSEWKEEIVYVDTDVLPRSRSVIMPLDGGEVTMEFNSDLREDYVEWLTSAENRQFARTMANRVWFWIMGRGVVSPADDFRDDNPPSNVALLDYLTDSFIAQGYDIRALYREILLSSTFQRSSLSTADNPSNAEALFAYYPTIRLTAEQLIDGISQITNINDRYVSRVPEPYSYYPADMHSYIIGDASVSSSQLDLFGRPSRDNSLESGRNNNLNSKQTLYLLNSNNVLSKIENSKRIKEIVERSKSTDEMIEIVYVMMLTRYPSTEESTALKTALGAFDSRQKAAENLIWALLNSSEFMFNH